MMCQKNCGTTVHNALVAVDGVVSASVSFKNKLAVVKCQQNVTVRDLVECLEMVGFDAEEKLKEIKLTVLGMMCQKNCGTTVFNALISVEGVAAAEVSYSKKLAVVKCKEEVKVEDLIENLENIGFEAFEQSEVSDKANLPEDEQELIMKKVDVVPEEVHIEVEDGFEVVELDIKGMTCSACVGNVEKHGSSLSGVEDIKVALVSEQARVVFDPDQISGEDIAREITGLGYKATVKSSFGSSLQLYVSNLKNEEDQIQFVQDFDTLDGILAIDFGKNTQNVDIAYDEKKIGARDLVDTIRKHAYYVDLRETTADQGEEIDDSFEKLFFSSLYFTLPIVFISVVVPEVLFLAQVFNNTLIPGLTLGTFILFLLSSVVQFKHGKRFYINGYKALSHGATNMDVLVALGTTAAYGYAVFSMLISICLSVLSEEDEDQISEAEENSHFFETSAMLISFILMGKYLEHSAKLKTAGAVNALMNLQTPTALLVENFSSPQNGSEPKKQVVKEIDLRLVQLGDILQVLPGATVPVDGVVVKGSSKVNESMLTGESFPVSKKVGSEVIGSTVNTHGSLYIEATKINSDTALSKIIKLVQDAQTSKAPIQAMADRISSVFVPAVVAVACLTWFVWFMCIFGLHVIGTEHFTSLEAKFVFCFKFGISVLVISCPCALGLATPTAVMVATGVGAKKGILIKGGDALERGANITTVLFDKTGTLTTGSPSVSDYMVVRGSKEKFFTMVGSVEKLSEHPLAKAVVHFIEDERKKVNGLKAEIFDEVIGFKAISGRGIEATVKSESCFIGNAKFMEAKSVDLSGSENVRSWKLEKEQQGATVVLVALKGNLAGAIAIRDQVKSTSRNTVSLLNERGINTWMITGDDIVTAKAIAKEVGIREENILANVLPGDKSAQVTMLQDQGEVVAMVGDGINDSPALTAADLGIAIGSGTDVAVESADVVLIRNDLLDVVEAIELAKATVGRIRMNFGFSFGYNILCIPIAAGLLYPWFGISLPPPVAGFMMAMSSVSVVVSSLMLQYFNPKIKERIRSKRKMGKNVYAGLRTDDVDDESDWGDLAQENVAVFEGIKLKWLLFALLLLVFFGALGVRKRVLDQVESTGMGMKRNSYVDEISTLSLKLGKSVSLGLLAYDSNQDLCPDEVDVFSTEELAIKEVIFLATYGDEELTLLFSISSNEEITDSSMFSKIRKELFETKSEYVTLDIIVSYDRFGVKKDALYSCPGSVDMHSSMMKGRMISGQAFGHLKVTAEELQSLDVEDVDSLELPILGYQFAGPQQFLGIDSEAKYIFRTQTTEILKPEEAIMYAFFRDGQSKEVLYFAEGNCEVDATKRLRALTGYIDVACDLRLPIKGNYLFVLKSGDRTIVFNH
eukprot:augustus_masked-scaffold_52-processed-gene-0.38-mRNA-1 protein AED:0.13 eAED:0.13 QI:0/-1/0/1/-1/1/1/0/1372